MSQIRLRISNATEDSDVSVPTMLPPTPDPTLPTDWAMPPKDGAKDPPPLCGTPPVIPLAIRRPPCEPARTATGGRPLMVLSIGDSPAPLATALAGSTVPSMHGTTLCDWANRHVEEFARAASSADPAVGLT